MTRPLHLVIGLVLTLIKLPAPIRRDERGRSGRVEVANLGVDQHGHLRCATGPPVSRMRWFISQSWARAKCAS